MKTARELPFFGAYTMPPLWFINYCVPRIKPSASIAWMVLFSKIRWSNQQFDVKISVRSIANLCGFSKDCAQDAISELIGEELLTSTPAKTGAQAKTYTVKLYTAEKARDMFKNKPRTMYGKSGHSSVRKNRQQKAS